MRQFLMSKNSGCLFAHNIAKQEGGPLHVMVAIGEIDSVRADVEEVFDDAAGLGKAAMVVFRDVVRVEQLVDVLRLLASGPRWRFREAAWKERSTGDVLLGIDWTTTEGKTSSVMGMAPFPCMPIYRRAPFPALVVWAGGHLNPHWLVKDRASVGLVDMPTGLDKERHDRAKVESFNRTDVLRGLPGSMAAQPNVAFSLPRSMRGRLLEECGMLGIT